MVKLGPSLIILPLLISLVKVLFWILVFSLFMAAIVFITNQYKSNTNQTIRIWPHTTFLQTNPNQSEEPNLLFTSNSSKEPTLPFTSNISEESNLPFSPIDSGELNQSSAPNGSDKSEETNQRFTPNNSNKPNQSNTSEKREYNKHKKVKKY